MSTDLTPTEFTIEFINTNGLDWFLFENEAYAARVLLAVEAAAERTSDENEWLEAACGVPFPEGF